MVQTVLIGLNGSYVVQDGPTGPKISHGLVLEKFQRGNFLGNSVYSVYSVYI